MDDVMNTEDKQHNMKHEAEHEKMAIDSHKSCEDNVFKKARHAWQIKGHPNINNAFLNGEKTSCDISVSDGGSHDTFENEIENDIKGLNASGTVLTHVMPEKMTETTSDHCRENRLANSLDLVLKGNEKDLINGDTHQNFDVIESKSVSYEICDLAGNKRKYDLENLEAVHKSSKRVRSQDNSKSTGSCSSSQSVSGISSSERFGNLQAGLASASNNRDFGRAVSSILPNFQGFDIPSFIWQKQEMGCAIVDNVFNRTLEEMGLSPDPVVNLSASTRLSLENQSIESAIRNQGLRASSTQSEQHTILNNMEQMRHNASREDFEHTQAQLSRILNSAETRSRSVIDNGHRMENCAMNVQISEQEQEHCDNNRQSNSQLVQCSSSVVSGLDLNRIIVPSAVGNHGDDDQNSGIRCIVKNHDIVKNRGDVADALEPANETVEYPAMEDSDNIHCKDTAEKQSENVLDLAVSTAILNQGLTYDSV